MAIAPTTADLGTFVVQKDIVSSTLTTSDVNIVEVLGEGIAIEDVIVRTDATGLAGATNFVLKADGITFFAEAVANLGANKIVDLTNASVTKTRAVIKAGTKYVTVAGTVGAGTGAGVISVFIRFRRLDTNSIARAL